MSQPNQSLRVAGIIPSSKWTTEETPSKANSSELLHLPPIEAPPMPASDERHLPTSDFSQVPLISLLPPRSIAENQGVPGFSSPMRLPPVLGKVRNGLQNVEQIKLPIDTVLQGLTAAAPQPPEPVTVDPAMTGVLTSTKVNELAQRKIRKAYALAERGAYYSARRELIETLRHIARSHDAREGMAGRTLALAEGLRALEEVEDFAPRGTQTEAEMNLDIVCASHGTKLAANVRTTGLLPQQMMDLYYRHAQLRLGASVAGEPAGSMALHALGKLYSRLEKSEPGKHRLAHRHAVAFQQAALRAHKDNHLASHELGVLLAQSGHFKEAQKLLQRVAQREPHPVVLRNLARVQQEMGLAQQALATREHASRVARGPQANQYNHVQWISPEAFTQGSAPQPRLHADMNVPLLPGVSSAAPPVRAVPRQPASHFVPQANPAWQTPVTANVGSRVATQPVFYGRPPETRPPTRFVPATMPPRQWR